LGKIRVVDHSLIAEGELGYEHAGRFATLCDRFLRQHAGEPATIDLSAATELVSPCLSAIYEDCRLHRPAQLKLVVPGRIARLFEPGQIEGLYTLEVL
jgi:hypothetical protein